MITFEQLESSVHSHCRSFPTVFTKGRGRASPTKATALTYIPGRRRSPLTIDTTPEITRKVVEYIENDGIIHSLDLHTAAKRDFLRAFQASILKPRGLSCRIQFHCPVGTNAIEAALKLARKVTGRQMVIFFEGGYHGRASPSFTTPAAGGRQL